MINSNLKKELVKHKRIAKKAEKDVKNLEEEVNRLKNESYQHVRTIRNLNDSLDLLKRSCFDLETKVGPVNNTTNSNENNRSPEGPSHINKAMRTQGAYVDN